MSIKNRMKKRLLLSGSISIISILFISYANFTNMRGKQAIRPKLNYTNKFIELGTLQGIPVQGMLAQANASTQSIIELSCVRKCTQTQNIRLQNLAAKMNKELSQFKSAPTGVQLKLIFDKYK